MMFKRPFLRQGEEGDEQWYFYVLGIFIIGVFTVLGQIPLFGYLMHQAESQRSGTFAAYADRLDDMSVWPELGVSQNAGLALMLLSFAIGCIGLFITIRYLHKRSFKSLITPIRSIRWNRIFFGFVVWFIISAISQVIDYYAHPEDFTFQFNARQFIGLVIICLTILPFQTSFEELVMRGYLMPPIARLIKIPLLSALITGAAFGALHIGNPEVQEYGLTTMLIYYVSAGLFLGIMTIMDNGLELALGVHFATNFSSALFVTYDGAALQTPALFRLKELDAELMSLGFIGLCIVFLVICHYALKWRNWNYLIQPLPVSTFDNTHLNIQDELHV